jgi:uncharacterized protein YdhG (YjbR/CyaY superfamily)
LVAVAGYGGMKRTMKANTPRDAEDYLARIPAIQRKALEQLRRTIKSIVPDAVEVISYQIPTFKLNGRMLVSYAAFNEHCSFFPGAGPVAAHEDELKSFVTSKGTVRFTPEKPLPVALVKKLVRTRIKLNEAAQKRRQAVR